MRLQIQHLPRQRSEDKEQCFRGKCVGFDKHNLSPAKYAGILSMQMKMCTCQQNSSAGAAETTCRSLCGFFAKQRCLQTRSENRSLLALRSPCVPNVFPIGLPTSFLRPVPTPKSFATSTKRHFLVVLNVVNWQNLQQAKGA